MRARAKRVQRLLEAKPRSEPEGSPAPARPGPAHGPLGGAGPMVSFPVQRRAVVNQPDDPYEREADAVAERVAAGTPAPAVSRLAAGGLATQRTEERAPPAEEEEPVQMLAVQRMCADCAEEEEAVQRQAEDDEEEPVQRDGEAAGITPSVTRAARAAVRDPGAGAPMHAPTRRTLETHLGADLGAVRVHDDGRAHDHARALRARAFTHGRDIWLGPGESQGDLRLMAHETTHTLQQGAAAQSPAVVQREPYETRGIALDRAQMQSMAGQSYWEQRTFQAFVTTVPSRFSDTEERDAALSAFWAQNPPTRVTAQQTMLVPVAPRPQPATGGAAATTAPALIYRFILSPAQPRDARPLLTVEFVASGAPAVPVTLSAAPAGFTPATPAAFSGDGFPSGLAAYWAAHPAEHAAVFHWVQNSAPATFDQIVTTGTTDGNGRVTHRSVLHLQGEHAGSTVNRLDATLLAEAELAAMHTPAASYRERNTAELEVERLQARSGPAANRLGVVTLPTNLPPDERLPVNFAVWQYFDAGNARNTEVDAVVPVGGGSRTVLYQFVFGAGNTVTVTRIGEQGTGAGQVDTGRMDVQRVRGFPGAGATPGALRTWWAARYPHGGALPAETAPGVPDAGALITEMNRLLTAGIANATWFQQNYGVEMLSAADAATRLQSAHSVPATMTADTVGFDAQDRRMVELAFQTMTASEITLLRGVKLVRKTASIRRSGTTFAAGNPGQYGLTLTDGSERTVLYFDPLYQNNAALFRGGSAAAALPDATMGVLHELGHAIEHQAGIEAAFRAWLRAHAQTAPTWYAASGASERFPEFFALYHTDPIFFCGRYPELFAWFETLASTGAPPARNATLTAPTCPTP